MKRLILPLAIIAGAPFCALVPGSPINAAHAAEAPATKTGTPSFLQGLLFPHSILDRVLARAADKNGNVDYGELRNDKELAQYVDAVGTADLSSFPTWDIEPSAKDKADKKAKPQVDRSAEMVFWINAYNAHVLKTIADAYPIDSRDDVKDFDTAQTHRVAGKDYSFAQLRDVIAKFDPRALFTLTDGTIGGPLLAPQAYRFRDIDILLTNAVETFINDDRNVQVTRINNQVTVNDYLTDLNTVFTPAGERRKMAGVRYVLAAYTSKRGERSYLTTSDYQIVPKPRSRALNHKAK